MKLHRSIFLKELKERWPELISRLNDQGNLTHMEVSIFLEIVQYNIDTMNRKLVKECFVVLEKYLKNGSQELQQAIGVSFLEDLNLNDSKKTSRSWAFDLLLPVSKQNYLSLHL